MKNKHRMILPLAMIASLTLAFNASAALVYGTAGAASYSYSAGGNGALPSASVAALVNITVASFSPFGASSSVTGLTNMTGTVGSANFHFQTGPGLQFSNDINLETGTGRNNSGAVVAEYGSDNMNWTPWFSSTIIDQTYTASNVAAGKTDLYVRFTFDGATQGDTVISWGGSPERFFKLGGTVVAVPEPSAAMLGGLGLVALLRRRRA
jgi:uncharacterized protein (TIGR03382 family)